MIATDTLSLVFICCFLVGFGFFLITALLGGLGFGDSHDSGHVGSHLHFHIGDHAHAPAAHTGTAHAASNAHATAHTTGHHDGHASHNQADNSGFSLLAFLNPTTLGLFLLGFGLFGYVFHNLTSMTASLSLILAVAAGIGLAAILLLLLSMIFANTEGSTEQDVVDRTGMIGKVSITIPEKGLGEIIYTSPGGLRKSIPARGLDNQRLERDQEVVVVNYQNGVAEVDTWENFMHVEAASSDSTTSDEMDTLRSLLNDNGSSEMEILIQQERKKE